MTRLDMPSESAFGPAHIFAPVHAHDNDDGPAQSRLAPSYTFSTRHLPAKQQFEAYCAEFSCFGQPALPDGKNATDGFIAERTGYDLGPLILAKGGSDAYSFGRRSWQLPSVAPDNWMLVLRRSGWAEIDFDGNIQRFEGARLELFPVANPRPGRISKHESIFLGLPRAQFSGMEAMLDSMAQVGFSNYVHPLLSDYLVSLSDLLPNVTPAEAELAAVATVAMIRACTTHATDDVAMAQSPIMATRFEIAKRWIDQNLRSPHLTPESIQTMLAVSRRQLYKIFEEHGGPAHYVRKMRPCACHEEISNPNNQRSIGEIAEAYGFNDTAQFSRQSG